MLKKSDNTISRRQEIGRGLRLAVDQSAQDSSKAGERLKKHVYDYVVTDSKVERDFVTELDTSTELEVYAKLPRGFFIPTPVGDHNP